MKRVDTKFKIFSIPKTISLAFQDLDFIVDPFNLACGNPVIKIIKDPFVMTRYHCGKFCQRFYSGDPGFIKPVHQIALGLFAGGASPKSSQVFFEDIRNIKRFIKAQKIPKLFFGLCVIGEFFSSFQEKIACSCIDIFLLASGSSSLLAS